MAIYRRCGSCGKKRIRSDKCECLKEKVKEYNKNVRCSKNNKEYTSFYNSTQWKRMSKYIKIKYNGICLYCYYKYKLLNLADVVHHIVEIREDFSKKLDEDNLITLCHSCHNALHSNYTEKEKKELYISKNKFEKEFIYPRGIE